MGRIIRFKPARITRRHYFKWSCTLIVLLLLFNYAREFFQKQVRDDVIRRLNSPAQATLTYKDSPRIPIPAKLPFNLPGWFYTEEVKVVRLDFQYKTTPSDTFFGIHSLTGLTYLNLAGSRFSGNPLFYLSDLKHLEELSFYDTNVKDEELAYLKNMQALRILNLHDNLITDAGLLHLANLKNLESLRLSQTEITDAGLVHLSKLKKLRNLYLSDTAITDQGLVHLQDLKELTILSLSNTEVTDAGLTHLKQLSKLQEIYVKNTKVTGSHPHSGLIVLKQGKKKNEEKEIEVKSRAPSEGPPLSHTF